MLFFFFLTGCSNYKETFLMLWSFSAGDVGISLHKEEILKVTLLICSTKIHSVDLSALFQHWFSLILGL